MSAAQVSLANTLAKTLDDYNNNLLCSLGFARVAGEGFGGIVFLPAIKP